MAHGTITKWVSLDLWFRCDALVAIGASIMDLYRSEANMWSSR